MDKAARWLSQQQENPDRPVNYCCLVENWCKQALSQVIGEVGGPDRCSPLTLLDSVSRPRSNKGPITAPYMRLQQLTDAIRVP
jgi:hypothetical protein